MHTSSLALSLLSLLLPLASAQYTATYTYGSQPATSEEGQSGTNQCGTTSSQTSECQNAFINSVEDFCVWGPPATTSDEGDGTSKIGNVEQIVVSYCLKDGYGTRLIPSGTLTGAHFVKVVSDKVSYVQVTGTGDFTKILIPAGDEGGELDPHSWTGLGNPQGGLVFTNAFSGSFEQTHEWTSFMASGTFCFRACRDGPNAAGYCQHIYDVLDCAFTIPGSMDPGFDQCDGDPTDEAPGVYGGSTFQQGDPTTPAPHPAGATSQCTTYSSIGGGSANLAVTPSSSVSASASASASVTSATPSGSGSVSGSGLVSTSTSSTSGPISDSGYVSSSSGSISRTSIISTSRSGVSPSSTTAAAAGAPASATSSTSAAERGGSAELGTFVGAMAVVVGTWLF